MPIPQARDVDLTRTQLTAWLRRTLSDATDVAIGDIGIPSGSGFSNETLLVDASWSEAGTPAPAEAGAPARPGSPSAA